MLNFSVLTLILAAVSGLVLGVVFQRVWQARVERNKRRVPDQWYLRSRSLLTQKEQDVWEWLQQAFHEHHVLVKVPAIRFLLPRNSSEGQMVHQLLSGIYCTFTVCATDGTVIGCIDVPGSQGLKTSNRDLKQQVFEEAGVAYAVVRAGNLPAPEAVRAAFLGETILPDDGLAGLSQPAEVPEQEIASYVAQDTVPDALRPANGMSGPGDSEEVDMGAVATARSTLRAKLERSRKSRFTNFDPFTNQPESAEEKTGDDSLVQWEDSFILPSSGSGARKG